MSQTEIKDNRKGLSKTFKDLCEGDWFENGGVLFRVLEGKSAVRAFDGLITNFVVDAPVVRVEVEIVILKD